MTTVPPWGRICGYRCARSLWCRFSPSESGTVPLCRWSEAIRHLPPKHWIHLPHLLVLLSTLNDIVFKMMQLKNTESESASRKLYLQHYQYMYTVCGVIMLMLRIVYSEKSSIFIIMLHHNLDSGTFIFHQKFNLE